MEMGAEELYKLQQDNKMLTAVGEAVNDETAQKVRGSTTQRHLSMVDTIQQRHAR